MKIVHRITTEDTPETRRDFSMLGVQVPLLDPRASVMHMPITVVLSEDHPAWPGVADWIAARDAAQSVTTTFSVAEVRAAHWLALFPAWHHGYPEPTDDWGYLHATYDLSDYSPSCGIGLEQKAPFRMEREPRWGKRNILQLNWIFDEYFATPQLYRRVFEPFGIQSGVVLDTNGRELSTVVQLVAECCIEVELHDQLAEQCHECGRLKYGPHVRGPFPALSSDPAEHLVKTVQYFGSGASAWKAVIASQELVQRLIGEGGRGVTFWPVSTRPEQRTEGELST